VDNVFAEVPAGHMDIGNREATVRLEKTSLAYQLHPEEQARRAPRLVRPAQRVKSRTSRRHLCHGGDDQTRTAA